MITLRFDYIINNALKWFFNNINVNRKCTRRGLWDRDICDYAAIWWVLGRSLTFTLFWPLGKSTYTFMLKATDH